MRFGSNESSRQNLDHDRRRAERHENSALSCQIGAVVNISSSGMKIKCEGKPPIKVGQIIDTKLDSGSQRVSVQASVIWLKRRGFKSFNVGMKFINMKNSLKAAIESLAKFGYIDLEAAVRQKQPKSDGPGKGHSKPPIKAPVELPDYYAILGVRHDATASQIKKAYHKLAREYHPDSIKSDAFTAKLTEVNQAYSALRSNQSRRTYDSRRAG